MALCWAGFASLGAGLIHIAVVREHLTESPLLGISFIVVIGMSICAVTPPTTRFASCGPIAVLIATPRPL